MNASPSPTTNPDPPPFQAAMPRQAQSQAPPPDRRGRKTQLGLVRWFQQNTFAPRWLPEPLRHPWVGYLAAALLELTATAVILLLLSLFPSFAFHGVLTDVIVVLIALGWGAGPGLCATLVGTLLLYVAVLLPHFSFSLANPADSIGLLLYLVVGLCICLLASRSERARRQLEEKNLQLAQAEARSRSDAQRLRTVLEIMPSAVAIAGPEGQLLEMNQATRTIWGEQAPLVPEIAQYARYKGWWARSGQPLAAEDWGMARALTRGEISLNEEVEIETFDGQHKIILNSAAPLRDETGAITGGVVNEQDITKVRRLEREVAEHAQELEAIFEALTDGLLVYDAQGRILRSNLAARQLLGFEAHPEFAALPWPERALRFASRNEHGQSIPLEHLALSRLLQGGVITSAQAADQRLATPDGREVTLSFTGRPLHDDEGEIIGAVVVARDVTERRRLERQVAEHAAQLETIFESIADGVVVTDRQGRVLHMNPAFRTLLGLELDPSGWTFPQLAELAGFTAPVAAGQRLIEGEDPIVRLLQGEVLTNEQSVDTIIQTCEGRETWVNSAGAPIRDVTGHLLGSVLVARDVTEQRRLEQQTRDTLNALLAMAEALVHVPDQAAAPGTEVEQETHPAARRLAELTLRVLGCQQVSIVAVEPGTEAMRPIMLVGLTPEQEQQWWSNLEECPPMSQRLHPDVVAALEAGEPVLLERLQPPLPIWQHLTPERASLLVPMRIGETLVGLLRIDDTATGEVEANAERRALLRAVARLGALVLERKRLLREREEAHASVLAMREANRQLETFLGMASHELKTPLTSILMGQELLQRRVQRLRHVLAGATADVIGQVDAVQALADTTSQQAGRLNRLVNDLLDASRIQTGRLTLRITLVDLATIVRSTVQEQQAEPERLLLSLPNSNSVPVQADAERIGQVITNYLTNALKYSPEDRPVAVGLDMQDQQARVWVRDEGPGIPLCEQERVWERFHRVPGIEILSGSGIGLGIGLYISKTIIDQHGGQVGVQSTRGAGATFWFTLPLASTGLRPPHGNS